MSQIGSRSKVYTPKIGTSVKKFAEVFRFAISVLKFIAAHPFHYIFKSCCLIHLRIVFSACCPYHCKTYFLSVIPTSFLLLNYFRFYASFLCATLTGDTSCRNVTIEFERTEKIWYTHANMNRLLVILC